MGTCSSWHAPTCPPSPTDQPPETAHLRGPVPEGQVDPQAWWVRLVRVVLHRAGVVVCGWQHHVRVGTAQCMRLCLGGGGGGRAPLAQLVGEGILEVLQLRSTSSIYPVAIPERLSRKASIMVEVSNPLDDELQLYTKRCKRSVLCRSAPRQTPRWPKRRT